MTELKLQRTIQTEWSPSIMYNNLSSLPNGSVLYAHLEDVVLTTPSGCSKLTQPEPTKAPITTVGGVAWQNQTFVGLANRNGFFLFDPIRNTCVLRLPAEGSGDIRGFAFVWLSELGFPEDLLLVGEGSGDVIAASLNNTLQITKSTRVRGHTASISCVAARQRSSYRTLTIAASGDSAGTLCVWQFNSQSGEPFVSNGVPNTDDCVTSIVLFNDLIANGNGSGSIRIYGVDECDLRISIAAHSRWINSIAYCPTTNMLASCAEDQLLCLWKMPSENDGGVLLAAHKLHSDQLMTGCCFGGTDGRSLFSTSYDSDAIWVYLT